MAKESYKKLYRFTEILIIILVMALITGWAVTEILKESEPQKQGYVFMIETDETKLNESEIENLSNQSIKQESHTLENGTG